MSQTVVIIDYGSGNLRSAQKSFERAAAESGAASEIVVTADPTAVAQADRIVLPGVGAFADCKAGVEAVPGLMEALTETVTVAKRPYLGICVGMQLMATAGLEHGRTDGFNWIAGEVRHLEPSDPDLKIPHMGWNNIEVLSPHPLFEGIETGAHVYFVHSYHFVPETASDRIVTTDYGGPVTAAIARDNMAGVQFHPEKSQTAGLAFIANFLKWTP